MDESDGAGHAGLDVQDGTFRQEPGSGVCGRVQGSTIAVGNLDWVRSHSQTDGTAAGNHDSSNSSSGTKHETSADSSSQRSHHSRSDSSSSSSSSSSVIGVSDVSSGHAVGGGTKQDGAHASDGEQASSSGRSGGGGAGVMTVYVGVDGKLAGVFEMRDQLRPDAAATIRGLQQQGIDTILLSGTRLPPLLCHAVLRVQYCAMLCLCCVLPCCAVLCCAVLRHAALVLCWA